MKYLDEFRDAHLLRRQLQELRALATRRWVIMDVCGGQTHSLLRHGIEAELEDVLELVHGPGCPVCVTPGEVIDEAIKLSQLPGVILTTFGDMLRVPAASGKSLIESRAISGDVRIVYAPADALEVARRNPDRIVVFFAVGFETTAPATALALRLAEEQGIENFLLLVHHVRVEPAMRAIAADPHCRVEGFLAAGHVCSVLGCECYQQFVDDFHLPVVVTGFEPLDLMAGLRRCVELLESNRPCVENCYSRCVREEGNRTARELIDSIYEPGDCQWRGFGVIPEGGLLLREAWSGRDARKRYPPIRVPFPGSAGECRSADVLSGRLKPTQCPHFGKSCTPETPLGAPMVSSEGACAAYFLYPSGTRNVQDTGVGT